LDGDIFSLAGEEERYGDETVTCGGPEVLDDVVFCPFVGNTDLVKAWSEHDRNKWNRKYILCISS
jgi:hypothetical protein